MFLGVGHAFSPFRTFCTSNVPNALSIEIPGRGSRKFEYYRSLESLRAYVLIASDRIHLDLYTREPSGPWVLTEADGLDTAFDLEAVDGRLPLAKVYEQAAAEILPVPTAG